MIEREDMVAGSDQAVVGATVFKVGDIVEFKSKWLKKVHRGRIGFIHGGATPWPQAQVHIQQRGQESVYEVVDLMKARKIAPSFP